MMIYERDCFVPRNDRSGVLEFVLHKQKFSPVVEMTERETMKQFVIRHL